MDKRSFLYVTLLLLCFLGINYYFDTKRAQDQERIAEKKKELVTDESHLSQQEITQKTAAISAFSLDAMYKDQEATEFLGYAFTRGDEVITLAWDEELPKQIFVNGKPALLISDEAYSGLPALYSIGAEQTLQTVELPAVGTTYLQCVTLSDTPSVYLGQYDKGTLLFPGKAPEENALVFYEANGSFYPIGYYDVQTRQYAALSALDELNVYLTYTALHEETDKKQERLYVLENEYQQVVLSNLGGSIAEVNLPLKNKTHPESVVRPIAFDTTITNSYPKNALFPKKPFYRSGEEQLSQPTLGGYYPLLRRGVFLRHTGQYQESPVRYNALNLVSDDPTLSTAAYTVTRFDAESIEFETKHRGRTIRKTFTLPKDPKQSPYVLDCSIEVAGNRSHLWLTSGVPDVEIISGSFMPALKYAYRKNDSTATKKIATPKHAETVEEENMRWISNGNGFFGMIIDPLQVAPSAVTANQIPGELTPTRLTVIDRKYNLYPEEKYPGYELLMPIKEGNTKRSFRLFAGPFDSDVLRKVDATYTDPQTGDGPNYIESQSFHGWFAFISQPFAKFLIVLMRFFHTVTGSWGFSIILLTVVLRLLLYPLNSWSIKSMAKMQEIGPKIESVREKYKKDQKRMQQEIMRIYKEEGGNPFSGCLPLLIQMPFLIGMFDLLKSSFELRGASFIPGWIPNLTAPDVLFSWSYPIPFIGTEFHLLPILLGGVMFFQQTLSQKKQKRKHQAVSDQQKQQQMMGKIMTIVFTVLFYKFPSGLNLYWISSMSLSILQQWYTQKRLKVSTQKK